MRIVVLCVWLGFVGVNVCFLGSVCIYCLAMRCFLEIKMRSIGHTQHMWCHTIPRTVCRRRQQRVSDGIYIYSGVFVLMAVYG